MRSIVSSIFAIMLFFGCSAENKKTTAEAEKSPAKKVEESAAPVAAKGDGVFADIKTNMGLITVQLEFEKTPLTVANFVGLAEGTKTNSAKAAGVPFYDGVIFHRIIKGFMIQTGDYTGTGRGNPGYRFPDEFDPTLTHSGPGILSMANAGRGTNGSQFFITHTATRNLDNKHTVFGHVVAGMDVVDAIANVQTAAQDRPVSPVIMESVKIRRVGAAATAFKGDEAHFTALQSSFEDRQKAKMLVGAIKRTKDEADKIKAQFPTAVLSADKSYFRILLKEGSGAKPEKGTTVSVHYTGKLLDGKEFDSSVKRNVPFKFPLGAGRVIKGWDLAVAEMNKGEKQTIILPPELGYGARGAGRGLIPPHAWLVFDVELIEF